MAKKRKFYKTVVTVTVLSEDYAPNEDCDLESIAYHIRDGNWSGEVEMGKPIRLTGKQTAEELTKQGSDPGFFSLDEKGRGVRE